MSLRPLIIGRADAAATKSLKGGRGRKERDGEREREPYPNRGATPPPRSIDWYSSIRSRLLDLQPFNVSIHGSIMEKSLIVSGFLSAHFYYKNDEPRSSLFSLDKLNIERYSGGMVGRCRHKTS